MKAPTLNADENSARIDDAITRSVRAEIEGRKPAPAPAPTPAALASAEIIAELDAIRALLLAKNAAYGNSALAPMRIFSRADEREGLRVRIDDKLSRVARGTAAGEDVVLDLIGYLVLMRIAERRAGGA